MTATRAARAVTPICASPSSPMPVRSPAEQGASPDAGQEHLDHAAGLLLQHPGQHHLAEDADTEEQYDGHNQDGHLVARATARDRTQFDAGDGHRRQQGRQGAGANARCGSPLADGGQLDGARHQGLELLVGLAFPRILQPPRALGDDVGVEAPLADGLLAGEAGVGVYAGRDAGGVGLLGDGGRQRRGSRSGDADVPGAAGLEQNGKDENGDHAYDHQHHRRRQARDRLRSRISRLATSQPCRAPFMSLTAWRNSSDNVGGW